MTRTLLLSFLLLLLLLAVAGWTVRAVRWAVMRPVRRGAAPTLARVRLA